MNVKAMIPLVAATSLGLVAAVAGWKMTQTPTGAPIAATSTKVVMVKDDVAPGAELTMDLLTLGSIPLAKAPLGAFTSIDQVAGRVPATTLAKGQPVFENFLAAADAGKGLAALVPSGMRAVSIEVNEYSGVGNLLAPGCRVDVVATFPVEQGMGVMTRTICQNLKVSAVGQRLSPIADKDADPDAKAPKSVTLLATPAEAQLIELACAASHPRLVLRSNRDEAKPAVAGVTLAELRGATGSPTMPLAVQAPATRPADTATVAAAPAPIPTRSVRIIRGGAESVVTFELRPMDGAVTRLPVEP